MQVMGLLAALPFQAVHKLQLQHQMQASHGLAWTPRSQPHPSSCVLQTAPVWCEIEALAMQQELSLWRACQQDLTRAQSR